MQKKRSLIDVLRGRSTVNNAANPASAHSRVMRATADKKKGKAPKKKYTS